MVDDRIASFELVRRVEHDERALHDINSQVVLGPWILSVIADCPEQRIELQVARLDQGRARSSPQAYSRVAPSGDGDDVALGGTDPGLTDRVLYGPGQQDIRCKADLR